MVEVTFPPFRARLPWWGADLQTLRNTIRPLPPDLPDSERVRLPLADGDTLLGLLNRPAMACDRPLAVLIHGLTGDEGGSYMRSTARALLAERYPVLRLNLRGAGPARALCRGEYHAGRSDDIRAALASLPASLTSRGVVLVGYSLGGNVLLKLLGEGEFPVPVRAAATVSAPIDLAATSRHFLRLRNQVYHRWLIGRMRADALATPGLGADWAERVRGSRTVWEFDDRFIAPRHGYADAAHYYQVNSANQFLPRIQVPTLAIHALDDPWIPGASYLSVEWSKCPAVKALLPRGGGHVGFHAAGGVWHDQCLVRFFARLVV